jgi:phosphatidylinositol kinase/protein kinase (PI-3  family)
MLNRFEHKGNDDMRQDAVMQQVFRAVNNWLRRDFESSRRNLCIRTYKCVPLESQAGFLFIISSLQIFIEHISLSKLSVYFLLFFGSKFVNQAMTRPGSV